jgi:hypothetical protein
VLLGHVEQGCQMVGICIPKAQFGYILEGLGMKTVGVFCGRMEYSRSFGIYCGPLVHFVVLWYFCGLLVHFVVLWYFCGLLVYFVVPWCILWSFGMFYGDMVYFMFI